MADEVTPTPSWISKWWPSLVVAAVTAAAWFVLAPWDWSTVDAAGHERTGATGDAWAALIGVALVSGMAVATVVRRRPDAVLRAPLAGLATFIVLYAWRASQARRQRRQPLAARADRRRAAHRPARHLRRLVAGAADHPGPQPRAEQRGDGAEP